MSGVWDTTISGVNEYMSGRDKEALVTFVQFNGDRVKVAHSAVPAGDIPALDRNSYIPASITPLYDAIGKTIRDLEKTIAADGDKKKPLVLVMIITDGQENNSSEFTRDSIFALIKRKTEEGWTFTFMGANQDAWAAGGQMGIPTGNIAQFTATHVGTKGAFSRMAFASNAYASTAHEGVAVTDFYAGSDEESDAVEVTQ